MKMKIEHSLSSERAKGCLLFQRKRRSYQGLRRHWSSQLNSLAGSHDSMAGSETIAASQARPYCVRIDHVRGAEYCHAYHNCS